MRVIESETCGSGGATEGYNRSRAYKWLAAWIVTLLIADQASKAIAMKLIEPYHSVQTPLGNLLKFTLIFNDGAAFGMMPGKRWFMVAIAALTAVAVFAFWKHIWSMGSIARISAAVVLAGSLGNMADRIRIGRVVDFIEVPMVPIFQVFNFADAFIVLGSIVFVYSIFRSS